MASAFDILGVLSFAQGAVTVVVAAFLAFRTSTDQIRDNDRKSRDLVAELYKLMIRLQQMERPIHGGLADDLERLAQEYASAIEMMRRLVWIDRWRRSNEIAASLVALSQLLSRLTSEVDFAVLDSRLLREFEAVQQRYFEKLQGIMVEQRRGRRASL